MVLVFPNETTYREIIEDIIATPCGVFLKYPIEGENIIGFCKSLDGRCAIDHHFNPDDIEWLRNYLSEDAVIFTDSLPTDWEFHVEK